MILILWFFIYLIFYVLYFFNFSLFNWFLIYPLTLFPSFTLYLTLYRSVCILLCLLLLSSNIFHLILFSPSLSGSSIVVSVVQLATSLILQFNTGHSDDQWRMYSLSPLQRPFLNFLLYFLIWFSHLKSVPYYYSFLIW